MNVKKNLEVHYQFIEKAAEKNTQLIVFPEMSITGYERESADQLAFSQNDSRLAEIMNLAVKHQMIIVAGAPIKIGRKLTIGSFIIRPDSTVQIYTKQYLHDGEENYFKPSLDFNPIVNLDEESVSFAICADIENSVHPGNAAIAGCSIYSASLFFSSHGIIGAHNTLSKYALRYSFNILMANFSGKVWNMESGGKSAFWNNRGELVEKLDAAGQGLLLVKKSNGSWQGETVILG